MRGHQTKQVEAMFKKKLVILDMAVPMCSEKLPVCIVDKSDLLALDNYLEE